MSDEQKYYDLKTKKVFIIDDLERSVCALKSSKLFNELGIIEYKIYLQSRIILRKTKNKLSED